MSTRRNALRTISTASVRDFAPHAGLWLDKFYGEPETSQNDLKRTLVESAAEMVREEASNEWAQLYKAFFERWKAELNSAGVKSWEATVKGRMIVGLGSESVWENSISLHHTYGVPFIAGTALKGLASSFARNRIEGWSDVHSKVAFGNTDAAGYVAFFDALYVPGSGHLHPRKSVRYALYPDVITVHHPKYYQDGTEPPADWDDPTPIPFISATGRYLIVLSGPVKWTNATFAILKIALSEVGIGAKTSSGYGRLSLP